MEKRKFALLTVLALLAGLAGMLLSSCAAADFMTTRDAAMDYDYAEEYAPAPEYGDYYDTADDGDYYAENSKEVVNGGGVGESRLRYIIRNGSINLSVKDTRETILEIRAMVEEAGGMISNSYVYEMREGQYAADLTLRVPEKRFEAIMDQLEEYGKATNVQTGLDDITMQYVDLESRLNNQKAQEARLVEILKMAETVEEVLEVERELSRVRGDIEAMTARLTTLKDQVSYATIHVSMREETIPTEQISPGAFDNLGERIMAALIGSINFILNAASILLVVFFALLPVMILFALIALIIWLIVRAIIKRNRRKQALRAEKAAASAGASEIEKR